MPHRNLCAPGGYVEPGDYVVGQQEQGLVLRVPGDREMDSAPSRIKVATPLGPIKTLQELGGGVRVVQRRATSRAPPHTPRTPPPPPTLWCEGKRCVFRLRGTHRYIRAVAEGSIQDISRRAEEGGYIATRSPESPPPTPASGRPASPPRRRAPEDVAAFALPGMRYATTFVISATPSQGRASKIDAPCVAVEMSVSASPLGFAVTARLPYAAFVCVAVSAAVVSYVAVAPLPSVSALCTLLCVLVYTSTYVSLSIFEALYLAWYNQQIPLRVKSPSALSRLPTAFAWEHRGFLLGEDGRISSAAYPQHQWTVDPEDCHRVLLTRARPGHAFDVVVV